MTTMIKEGDKVDEKLTILIVFVQSGGVLAPLAFIAFHIIRQFLFIPVSVVLIAGGVLFGTILGTIYSFIGLTIVSILFYFTIRKFPTFYEKLTNLKNKTFGPHRNLTVPQITVIRLIPFVHYHLMNFCLLERDWKFKQYFKGVLFTNIPLVLIYTNFGEFIRTFTLTNVIIILVILSIVVYILREKIVIVKWKQFFNETA